MLNPILPPAPAATACAQLKTGQNAGLGGFVPFGSASLWNADISQAPVDPNSDAIINTYVGQSTPLHLDFSADSNTGIPFTVVSGSQAPVNVNINPQGDVAESDPGPMPIPANAAIEASSTGSNRVLVLDKGTCFLYELSHASVNVDGSWNADSAAVWDLLSSQQRPYLWPSADAAGLPVFAGLVRYDEVLQGTVQHAFRFTLPQTSAAFTPPASHFVATSSDSGAPPMGMRLRLKASFDVSGFSPQMQVILNAMRKYGLILADNGNPLFVSGASDGRWGPDLASLATVPGSAFEVVAMNPVYTAATVPTGVPPSIASFSATPTTTSAGSLITLTWAVSDATYLIVSPSVGAVHGNNVMVAPSTTTTYTLYATNQFGRTQNTVTVTVP